MANGQGQHRKKVGLKNKAAVKKWMDENPDGIMMDCMAALNLSAPTVRKHAAAIMAEEANIINSHLKK